jgi:transposase
MALGLPQFVARLLNLQGVVVEGVESEDGPTGKGPTVVISVRQRAGQRPRCSRCDRPVAGEGHEERVRRWRTLPMLDQRCVLQARVRRVWCACTGQAHVEAVPWARPAARVTRVLERAVGTLSRLTDTTTTARHFGLAWRTVAGIEARLAGEQLTPSRFDGLLVIGVDEISHRRGQHYLTIVTDLLVGDVVWIGEGRSQATLSSFFVALGARRGRQIEAVVTDLHAPYHNAVRQHAPQAVLAFDRFHLVALLNKALDELRRSEFARLGEDERVWVNGTRWALLKDPSWLTPRQEQTLATLERCNRRLFRGYLLKEAFREAWVWKDVPGTKRRLKRWLAWALRCRLRPLVRFARTVRAHLDGILTAVELGLSSGIVEGINNKIKTILKRSYGFLRTDTFIRRIDFCCLDFEIT